MTDSSFPDTHRSWIVERIQAGEAGASELRNRMMELYLEPLRAAGRAAFGMSSEQALDLVHGFFASRLSRPDYFDAWGSSGKRLRHWLWNGLCFYLRERQRSDRRMTTMAELPDVIDESAIDPGRELDRSFAVALMRAALDRAARKCEEDGFGEHWSVFVRRQVGGEPLVQVARDLGMPVERATVMLRAPQRRLANALCELLVADGVPAAEVPRAIAELLAANAE